MDNRPTRGGCTVQVKLELGHRAQLRKKITSEGFTHDWMVFVRGPETGDIQHFVEKVVFRLHESFPKPKRVCKEPPYKVEESGYAGFLMPIEVYFKNKEEPKKVLNHLRCEKLTFNNPTKEFRRKLIKAGGVLVVPEGAEAVSRPSPDYPILPTIPSLPFQTPRRQRPPMCQSKEGSGSSKGPKPHKLTKEHRERPRKDSESKATSKDSERDGSSKSSRDPSSSSKKPSDVKVKDEVKVLPKAAFKEPKLTLKESKMEGMSPKGGGGSGEAKAPGKRPSTVESPKPSNKKQKKGSSEGPKGAGSGGFTGSSPRVSSSSAAGQPYAEKKPPKDKGAAGSKARTTRRKSKSCLELIFLHFSLVSQQSAPSSPSGSSSSSDSSSDSDFEPGQKPGQGKFPAFFDTTFMHRLLLSELVDLHRRLMALRERNVLQQIVNLIEETGHFNVTNTTFDFDLFSLDESTVRKLQSYLEATAT
uniref:MLLT1 super elongation complex subunit a n=1 Tax=Neogobius melanostomus TaxID=47308 RepID=A0A8C6V363_9GOBI